MKRTKQPNESTTAKHAFYIASVCCQQQPMAWPMSGVSTNTCFGVVQELLNCVSGLRHATNCSYVVFKHGSLPCTARISILHTIDLPRASVLHRIVPNIEPQPLSLIPHQIPHSSSQQTSLSPLQNRCFWLLAGLASSPTSIQPPFNLY